MFVLKFFSFIIYSLGVIIFLCYINLFYSYNVIKDGLLYDYKNMSEFDYIIVGAGSAGSTLAAKLSNTGAKILLLEAGGPPLEFFNIPVIAPLLFNTVYDWQYKTVPQDNACKGLINNQSTWPSGKILGGSSRLNSMVYVRGHSNDFISWLPEFKELAFRVRESLFINDQNWHSKLSDAILQGVFEMPLPLGDINEKIPTGFMRAQLTIKNGERWSTDRVFEQNKSQGLKILSHALVTKILLKSHTAVGVEFFKSNKMYRASARRGVILSAGAISTPKLLMLSGIGPKNHLEEVNVQTVVDLPVGQNLMDHIITGLDLVILNKTEALSIIDIINPYSILEYYLFGTGPWTSAGVEIVGTFHSTLNKNKSSEPDLQIMTLPVGLSQDNGFLLRKNLGISDKIFDQYFSPLAYKNAISIAPILLHPKSIGDIKLRSSNPLDPPLIDPKYLSNEDDVLTLIDGIKFVKKLIKTKSMKRLGAQLYKKPFPGCEKFPFDTNAYWKCYVKHLTLTTYHPGGTCKMGSVVDTNFRVYQTNNLFVVDASVLPQLPSGNIHTSVIMLSEKAGELLIEDFQKHIKIPAKCYKSDIFLWDKSTL